jgi:alpha-L-rhamnosidase
MTKITSLVGAVCIAALISSCASESRGVAAPFDPVVNEGFENPLGFYDAQPRFSWKLPVADGVRSQSAYRIVVASDPGLLPDRADLWDTRKVDSDQSAWIDYSGDPLDSRQKVYWQAMYWDQDGADSAWSPVSHLELGLLDNTDWQARWISLPRSVTQQVSDRGYHFHRPQYLRKEFRVDEPIRQARLYITAKGVFEAEINGQRVGEDIMTPGWTPYKKRIETLTYDVTEMLTDGHNAIGVSLADGWYAGRIAFRRSHADETPVPQILGQLEITYASGEVVTVATDGSWQATASGPIRMSDIYEGEDYDANFEFPGWSTAGFDTGQWTGVVESEVDADVSLSPKRHAPVRDKRTLPAVAISEPEAGKIVFDLGQNMVGVAELNIPVKAKQDVTVRFAEMLEEDGTLYTDNYRSARSANVYTPSENGVIRWRPKFTFHGFRYVELGGFDADVVPQKDWVTGIVQYSDFDSAGSFASSHDRLNQLQSNIAWGLYGNFFDIPTDCPQRDERMGWTGDAQVFAPTSIFNSDVHAFWASWLQSVREEQFADGGIPFVVPNNRGKDSSSGWADAATIIPWQIYLRTGDTRLLEENYNMMRRLVDYYRLSPDDRSGELTSFGDWLQPYSTNPEDSRRGDTPNELIEAAYFAHSVQQTLNAAEVLGRTEDATELRALRDKLRADFTERFLDDDGRLTIPVETQTGYLLALGFNLVPDDLAHKAVSHLLRTIAAADNHLRTGFLGTPLLAPVLSRYGHTDLVYELLFTETYPSWLYPINQGATTMWERWNSYSHEDGFGDATMNSFNHYAYGAIGEWMYEGIAGIRPLQPGFKRILIAPIPGGPLDSANAEYNSVYGRIASAWQSTGGGLELKVTVPPNTTAQVIIPASADAQISVDGDDIVDNEDISILARSSDNITLDVPPGSYVFATSSALLKADFIFEDTSFPSSHASTIQETESGLVAAWFGGTHEQHPDVGIWLSHYENGAWTTPVEVANGVESSAVRYPAWNPVLFQPQDGPLLLFYKVGPSPSDWWGMKMWSTDGGKTWSTPERLPDGILGPIKNKPIQLANGDILSPTSTEHDGWRVHFERSTDGGKTWTATDPVNDGREIEAIQPSLLQYEDGRMQALGRTRNFKLFSIWSDDGGHTWGEMELLELPNPSSGTDAVTLRDGRQLLVYNHNLREGTTNKGRSPLNIAISDDGIDWSAALVLEDNPDAPHGFPYPAVIQTSDGLVHITYTWQREVIKHAVIDPDQLELHPIVDGRWPVIGFISE